MNVYIFMGTHMPEIARCVDHLIKFSKELDPIQVLVPASLGWISTSERYAVTGYDPESVFWVFDPDQQGTAFIVIDPATQLIPQLEQLAEQLGNCLIEPVKIMTCVDCEMAENSAKLKGWLDACIYYSDIVLLGNRSGSSKSFVRDFQKKYERLCYPSLFMFLKGDGIPGSAQEILTPGTRRITQMFDLPDPSDKPDLPGMVIESSCDLELEESEIDPFRTPGEDESTTPIPDPVEFIIHHPQSPSKNP